MHGHPIQCYRGVMRFKLANRHLQLHKIGLPESHSQA